MAKDYLSYKRAIDQVGDMLQDFDAPDLIELIKSQARTVFDKLVITVTINIDENTKVKVSRTTKNKLKIKRTNTSTFETEV